LLGHTKIESTVRYLGVDVVDALALSEGTEVWRQLQATQPRRRGVPSGDSIESAAPLRSRRSMHGALLRHFDLEKLAPQSEAPRILSNNIALPRTGRRALRAGRRQSVQ
jgi:hypothetical protein